MTAFHFYDLPRVWRIYTYYGVFLVLWLLFGFLGVIPKEFFEASHLLLVFVNLIGGIPLFFILRVDILRDWWPFTTAPLSNSSLIIIGYLVVGLNLALIEYFKRRLRSFSFRSSPSPKTPADRSA